MTKYIIRFKYFKSDNYEQFHFYDNHNDKTIRDVKEFINCFDNSICPCMLNILPNSDYNDENKLNTIFEKKIINIEQKYKKCKCDILSKNNEKYLFLSKKKLINKINQLNNQDINLNEKVHDIIIYIKSLVELNQGLKIETTTRGEKTLNLVCVIGIIGNINQGKSFLISELTGKNILIQNNGLCINYLEINNLLNKYLVFLTHKGQDQPILEEKDKYEEKLVTNSFLLDFITYHSDILLLVIDYLSFSNQRLINTIKNKIIKENLEKKLFIIHNLKFFRKLNDVKYYIENILFKSRSFKVRENEIITSQKEKKIDGQYYTEDMQENLSIFHLIMAADFSEAGFYYNEFAKKFISLHYNNITNAKIFDAVENFISFFCLTSKIYLNQSIKRDDFISYEEILKENIIRLKENKEIKIKRKLLDSMNLQLLIWNNHYYEPKYSIHKRDNKLIFEIELSGNKNVDIFRPFFVEDKTIIIIKGKKLPDKVPKESKDNILDIRYYGNFEMKIMWETQDYAINPDIKSYKFLDGILYLEYELEEDRKFEQLLLKPEDEI